MSRSDFVYCPYCATALEVREVYRQQRPVCPNCRFIHFRDPKVAVIGFVTKGEQRDEVLLIRRAVDPGKGKWALPGGYMDAGEMPEAALQRELLEEVGLHVTVNAVLDIFPMVVAGDRSQGIVLAYHAIPAYAEQTTLLCDDDVCEAAWFTKVKLPTELAFESTHTLLAHWCEQ